MFQQHCVSPLTAGWRFRYYKGVIKEQVPQVDVGGGVWRSSRASGHVSSQVNLSSSSMEVNVRERWLTAASIAAHKQESIHYRSKKAVTLWIKRWNYEVCYYEITVGVKQLLLENAIMQWKQTFETEHFWDKCQFTTFFFSFICLHNLFMW